MTEERQRKEWLDMNECQTCKSNPHEKDCPEINIAPHESVNEWVNYIVSWRQRKGFVTSWDNFTEKAMLIVTEVSELVEAKRKCISEALEPNDVHEACRFGIGEEIADIVIRTMDLAGSLGFDLEAEIAKKMQRNEDRPYRHGKAF